MHKACKQVYEHAKINLYATEDLKIAYEKEIAVSNGAVVYFSSLLKPAKTNNGEIKNLVYSGNLYNDRAKSLIEISEYIANKPEVFIHLFGTLSKKALKFISNCKNIIYHGIIPYNQMVEELYKCDLLIHIEGFSRFYKKDCKYAFSTKIADYYLLNKPFFAYGPLEISGIKFMYQQNEKYVATSQKELNKLDAFFAPNFIYESNYNFISMYFDAEKNRKQVVDIIDK